MRHRHPPQQPGWIDRPHRFLEIGDLPLENGQRIADCSLCYVEHGTANHDRSNAVLALSAIGSTHHRLDAWIGPGRALDTDRWWIICVDALGNGLSSSPSTSERQPGLAFPRFTIRDMVASQRRLLDHLAIGQLRAVVGASMGGMQALQWAVSHPARMQCDIALVPMARTSPWSRAINEVGRRLLTSHPDWWAEESAEAWIGWTALMRLVASRTPQALARQYAKPDDFAPGLATLDASRAAAGLSAVDWVYQSFAYDTHDVGLTPGFDGDLGRALATVRARTLIAVPPLDLYNPVEAGREAAALIPGCELVEIPSIAGHQAAGGTEAAETAFLDAAMRRFLA
ncbi:MAG: alpha/beta fold hydrolase [Reyranella sp.]|uniref:alpha/beta fold hydrolase n=1 Tax=Reyranella sp. TaxID=1929291 RepID=UPI003D0F060E